MVAYAIARNMHRRLFNGLYFYFVSALFVPFPIIMLPVAKQTAILHLDNRVGLILLYVVYGLAFNIFIFTAYIHSIPTELEEAAVIDGASHLGVFWKVIFPLLAPMNATVGILTCLWAWNDFLLPLVILSDPGSATLPLVQYVFQSQFQTNYPAAFASYLMAMAPAADRLRVRPALGHLRCHPRRGQVTAHLIGTPGDTGLVLIEHPDRLPTVAWCGVVDPALTAGDLAALGPAGMSMLPEGSHVWYGRTGLSGHRGAGEPGAWSTRFVPASLRVTAAGATIEATDPHAGLAVVTDVQAVPGGLLRIRHILTNTGSTDYMLEALDVVVPAPDHATESLDFTGRWARERIPQRRPITDGLWLRENRRGKTGFDAATVLTAGTSGFGFGHGQVWGVHVAWSGNHVHRLERVPRSKTTRPPPRSAEESCCCRAR